VSASSEQSPGGEAKVTFQVNLAPTDYPTVRHVLPHQLRCWAGQVAEVLLVVDLHRSQGLQAQVAADQLPNLRGLIADCQATYTNVRAVDVDYSEEALGAVGEAFYRGGAVPLKDWRAAPIYPYFYGLYAAAHGYIFHNDSDMMYGGGSQTWIAEALEVLQTGSDILICSPLPGPPTAGGELRSQTLVREPMASLAYRADAISTRVFMIDLHRFRERVIGLDAVAPNRWQTLMARVDGNPSFETAEIMLSQAMRRAGLARVDFLGAAPGMWSVHPPYRSDLFYERLPELIAQIESGEVADGQRGDHELNDSMIDWSSARKPRWQRWAKHAQLLARNLSGPGPG
jgi:hypothetical protein